MIYSWTSN